ncbi:MAG: M50 family metallopeptidase [Synechococcaceae cyanobacterium ELA445]
MSEEPVPEDLFERAVRRAGQRARGAMPPSARLSRLSERSVVLVGEDGRVLARIPRVQLEGGASGSPSTPGEWGAAPLPWQWGDPGEPLALRRYLLPAATLFALLVTAVPGLSPLLFGVRIWFHEFGHALVAWLSGRRALPLPMGWTSTSLERSPLVMVLVLFLILVLLTMAWRERKAYTALLASGLILAQIVASISLDGSRYGAWFAWGGVAGEFLLPAVLMAGSLFLAPAYFCWERLRFAAAVGGSLTFWAALREWRAIAAGQRPLPLGSLWGGEDIGDMNTLLAAGWSPQAIADSYLSLALFCLLGLAVAYGLRQRRGRRGA